MPYPLIYSLVFAGLLSLLTGGPLSGQGDGNPNDYMDYHALINRAESYIADERFPEALQTYEAVFASFDFVFCRDYKVAAQVAVYLGEHNRALTLVKAGFTSGWELGDAKRLASLAPLRKAPGWKDLEDSYETLRGAYLEYIDTAAREAVQDLFRKDQKMAMGALLRIGDKAQTRYAEVKFAPHSERQLAVLRDLIDAGGYPGERRIGNDFWGSTVLSHHNSISTDYNKKDTLYPNLRPRLLAALRAGEISPYEIALVEDWKIASVSGYSAPGYGYLNPPSQATLRIADSLRQAVGLRSIDLRNRLVEVEKDTGMEFFLPDWVKGKIKVGSEE